MGVAVLNRPAASRPGGSLVESADSPSIVGGGPSRCPEIDCIRHLLSNATIDAAERRAASLGVGADRALINAGTLSEEIYLRELDARAGILFEPLEDVPRDACSLADERLLEAATHGILPLRQGKETSFVVAPRGLAVRRILQMHPASAQRFRFTTAERMNSFILRHADKALAVRASTALKDNWPVLSAAPASRRRRIIPVAIIGFVAAAAAIFAPDVSMLVVQISLAIVFLAWLALRIAGAAVQRLRFDTFWELRDDELPVYTVIAPLYREASSVGGLLSAIERLDYPREKLDIIIAVEADDAETRAAIAARINRFPITVIPVPAYGPRTKPKALNTALPFARGTFAVIYDAEDRPEPNQLREALQAFCAYGDELACVQARLCIDNTEDGWLARMFTAEYGGQFDVFLPGFAALHLPLPLGGSSNHFRTQTLREIGAWDPYNVTEDADLGMRLARFGYRAGVIESTTHEEAPTRFGAWLRQRTRWFKGWMQTWLVHMRHPLRLLRDLGLPGFLAFQLIVGGNVLAALVHPLFMAALIYSVASGAPMWRGDSTAIAVLAAFYGITVVIGYAGSAFLGWLGLARRGLLSTAWVLLLTPVHWLLLSLAAWRALYQLISAPYRWEKTEHGLARSSRRAANLTRSLIELERYLSALKESGQLPALANETHIGQPA